MDGLDESDALRRSERENKGKKPKRFGFTSSASNASKSVSGSKSRKGLDNQSTRSSVSRKSGSTAATTKERIEIEADAKQASLRKELRDLESELEIVSTKKDRTLNRISAKKAELRGDLTGALVPDLQKEIRELENEVPNLEDKINALSIQIRDKKIENEDIIKLVEREKAVKLAEVEPDDEDDENENEVPEVIDLNNSQRVDDWATSAAEVTETEAKLQRLQAEETRLLEEKLALEKKKVEQAATAANLIQQQLLATAEAKENARMVQQYEKLLNEIPFSDPAKSNAPLDPNFLHPTTAVTSSAELLNAQAELEAWKKRVESLQATTTTTGQKEGQVQFAPPPPPQMNAQTTANPLYYAQGPVYSRVQFPVVSTVSSPVYTSAPSPIYSTTATPMFSTAPTGSGILPGWENLGFGPAPAPQQQRRDRTEIMLARQSHSKDLPFFDGNPGRWLKFKCAYDRTTDLCAFDDVDNLNRLEKALQGKAKDSVECLLSNPLNVPQIMFKLEQRYGQPQFIIKAMLEKVRKSPELKEESLNSMIDFGNNVANLVATLQNLNRPEHLNNPILLEELEAKLSVSYQMQWRKWIREEQKSLDLMSFSEWLELNTQLACSLCPPKLSAPREDRRFDNRRNPRVQERVMVVAEEPRAAEEPPKKKFNKKFQGEQRQSTCTFCKLSHYIDDCKKFQEATVDERSKFTRENRLCFLCLKSGHGAQFCRSQKRCNVDNCNKKHHRLLHWKKKDQGNTPGNKNVPGKEDVTLSLSSQTENNEVVVYASPEEEQREWAIYKILEAKFRGPTGLVEDSFLIQDLCSGYSIIDEDTSEDLKFDGIDKPFTYQGLGYKGSVAKSKLVEFDIIIDGQVFHINNVQTGNLKDLPTRSLTEKDLKRWKHLDGIPIKTYKNAKPKLLLGLPHIHLIETLEMVASKSRNGPIACRSLLGWTVAGTATETLECRSEAMFHLSRPEDNEEALHNLIKESFKVDNIGVQVQTVKPRSKEDARAEEIMESTTKRIGDQFEIGLLWKEDEVKFPDSYGSCLRRLHTVERKMDKDPVYAKKFSDKIQEYEQKQFCRKLTPEEAAVRSDKTFYLPLFGVINPSKPEKFRLVHDAKAPVGGISLNDKLLQGPDYVPPLPAVLCRFRQRAIGFTADIADMFHMVRIRKEDQDAQRFLWRGMDRNKAPEQYIMQCMIFGATSSPSCAQYVKNRNAREVGAKFPQAVEDIQRNHYVDDYPGCTDTVEEAIQRFKEVTEIHRQGGFKICKWISSSRVFNDAIPDDLKAKGVKDMEMGGDSVVEKVLGLHWDPTEDIFTFKTNFNRIKKEVLTGERLPTKREALALIMSVYDPEGFVSLVTIKSRILFQDVWRSAIGWDDTIPGSYEVKWVEWIKELKTIDTFKLRRCYSPNFTSADEIQLHVFVDGSEKAYSAVAYFRVRKGDTVDVALVMGKARVAPLKPISIPRMELMGAIMGTRLVDFIKSEHDVTINKFVHWSDSSTVLGWIKSDGRKFKQFVACRVGEIQEASKPTEWRYVPTKENVADEATRDDKPSDFSPSSRWVNGPSWLKLSPKNWPADLPTTQQAKPHSADDLIEMKKEYVGAVIEKPIAKPIMDVTRFSSWMRLLNTTALVLGFIFSIAKHGKKKFKLTLKSIRDAETQWWKWCQKETYYEEIKILTSGQQLKISNKIAALSPFVDESRILRMRGRVPEDANVHGMEKNPVILHPKHPYTVLLIRWFHEKAGHHGQERVINDLRQLYCIPNVRAAVKKVSYLCQHCKNERAQPAQPMMGNVPIARLDSFSQPFTKTGVDYFGPYEVSVGYKRREKRYGCLFTCLTTRAVSLELAASLSTDSFLMALRRFIARRGCPSDIYSDNGTNFVGADMELKKLLKSLKQDQINAECSVRGIKWHFNPPAAPHMGGIWERMVKSVKISLNVTLKERAPKEEVLQTLFAEAEHTVNARPLTHVSVDAEDPEALTPNHFLIGRSSNLPMWRNQEEKENVCLRKMWEQSDHLANLLWKRWVKEFQPTLLRREKWLNLQKPLVIGDIVILVDPTQPRNCWPLGRIIAVYPGKDGQVRTVDVKTTAGTYRRPAVKICRLDVEKPAIEAQATTEDPGRSDLLC